MPVSSGDRIKAQAIATAFQIMLDEKPAVIEMPDHIIIRPSPGQAEKIRKMLEEWMGQKPGVVRVETSAILTPILIKKMAPILLMAAAGGFGLGKVT